MNEWIHAVLENNIFRGACAGLGAAALVDYAAFRGFKNLDEALRYDWKTACWRWGQGFVGGAITAAGYGSVIG